MRYIISTYFFIFYVNISLFSQVFDGEVKKISHYDPSGETIEYFRNIWYFNSKEEYLSAETKMFDNLNVALRTEKFEMIADDASIAVLNEIGAFTGLMRGYFYPKGSSIDDSQIKKTFMAYIAIDLSKYDIRVQFKGAYNQYMLNYQLEAPVKTGYAIFRIPSAEYRKDIEYLINAEKTKTKLTITAEYNRQQLKLIITRKEAAIASLLRKAGLNKRQILLFPEG